MRPIMLVFPAALGLSACCDASQILDTGRYNGLQDSIDCSFAAQSDAIAGTQEGAALAASALVLFAVVAASSGGGDGGYTPDF
jgi:hypothetical protein